MVHFCTLLVLAITVSFIHYIFTEMAKNNGSQIDFEDIVLGNKDPMTLWESWFKEAKTVPENKLPIGMTVATVQADRHPAARTMLMRGYDERGFQIYTDYRSPKAQDLARENSVALVFLWCFIPQNETKPGGTRQVRVEGVVEKLSQKENEQYFEQESIDSKIRAVVQNQSERITSKRREEMLELARELYTRFQADPTFHVPMPEKYGGYIVRPQVFEFFQATQHALATRVRFRKRSPEENVARKLRSELPDGVYLGAGDWVYEYLEF